MPGAAQASSRPKKTANVSPAYAAVINDFRRDRTPKTLSEYYAAWEKRVADMEDVDLNEVDPRSIRPEDVGFELGPPMTEDQFKAYRARKGSSVKVIGKTTIAPPQ